MAFPFGWTEAVESWRREKLEEAKQLSIGRQGINSTILQEEASTVYSLKAFVSVEFEFIFEQKPSRFIVLSFTFDYSTGMLVRVLESDWAALSEEIGLWIPTEIIHKEHGDKPKGVEDEDLGN